MANFAYIVTNLVDGTTITPSTEDTTYVKANLYNQRPGKPFKHTTTGGNIVVDLGSPASADAVAIIGHNFSGATITLEANATDAWGAPSLSESITIRSPNCYEEFTSASYRFWRLVTSGNASNVKIGELILGARITLTQNYAWEAKESRLYKNISKITDYGQPWSYHLYDQRSWDLGFPNRNSTTKTEIEALILATSGGNKPFLFVPGETSNTDAYYVTMQDELKITRHVTSNSMSLQLTELPLGKDIS